MTVALKVGLSLLILAVTLMLLYTSAYAFSVNRTLLAAAQWGMLLMGLLGVGAVWRLPGPWLVPALVVAGLAALVFAKMGGVF